MALKTSPSAQKNKASDSALQESAESRPIYSLPTINVSKPEVHNSVHKINVSKPEVHHADNEKTNLNAKKDTQKNQNSSKRGQFILLNPHTIIALSLDACGVAIFLAGLLEHLRGALFAAGMLFLVAFIFTAGSYYSQEYLLKNHSKIATTATLFASLFYRLCVTLIAAMEYPYATIRSFFGVCALLDVVANAVMFIECTWVSNSNIEDKESHYLTPLIWFYSWGLMHHIVRNVSSLFLVLFYFEATDGNARTKGDVLSESKVGYQQTQALYGNNLRGGAQQAWVTYSRRLALIFTAGTYLWVTANNGMLIAEGLMNYEGAWKDEVCNA
eukprot:CAMPEP_0114486174 /NCGR_PEP_ID=MMETSP0109-20121206/77_1 /TAXON_ID=29199 /ORGANISM="Chlorarachnion reptans, Strain CCCM449" /LENGTH=328 /DNA_ID=CAMNT_0001662325 /DNA_START=91 /DNA_END=1077 /DNA_ORIENTATION=+